MPIAAVRGFVAAICAVVLISPLKSGAQALERLFYYVNREDSYQSLVKNIDQITVLGPQVYTVDSLGVVFGEMDSRVLALAKAHHVKVMPLVVNEAFTDVYPVAQIAAYFEIGQFLQDSTRGPRVIKHAAAVRFMCDRHVDLRFNLKDLLIELEVFVIAPRILAGLAPWCGAPNGPSRRTRQSATGRSRKNSGS